MWNEEPDTLLVPRRVRCASGWYSRWLGALYFYKGALLALGAYMAWSTRKARTRALDYNPLYYTMDAGEFELLRVRLRALHFHFTLLMCCAAHRCTSQR